MILEPEWVINTEIDQIEKMVSNLCAMGVYAAWDAGIYVYPGCETRGCAKRMLKRYISEIDDTVDYDSMAKDIDSGYSIDITDLY